MATTTVVKVPEKTALVNRKLLGELFKANDGESLAIAFNALRLDTVLRYLGGAGRAKHAKTMLCSIMGWSRFRKTYEEATGVLKAQGVQRGANGEWSVQLPEYDEGLADADRLEKLRDDFVEIPAVAAFQLAGKKFFFLTHFQWDGSRHFIPRDEDPRHRALPADAYLDRSEMNDGLPRPKDQLWLRRFLRELKALGYLSEDLQLVGALVGGAHDRVWKGVNPYTYIARKDFQTLRGLNTGRNRLQSAVIRETSNGHLGNMKRSFGDVPGHLGNMPGQSGNQNLDVSDLDALNLDEPGCPRGEVSPSGSTIAGDLSPFFGEKLRDSGLSPSSVPFTAFEGSARDPDGNHVVATQEAA